MSDSMHHHHDLDLISALAEGTLADPTPAQGLVASCPECADLYHAHVTVRRAVEAETRPTLTDIERARLHSSVWEEVGRRPAPARTPASPWWYRIAPVAALLVVVVGIGVGGWIDGGDEAALEMAGEETTGGVETTADTDLATELSPLSDSPAAPEATEAPADTMAAATTAADGLDESVQRGDFTMSELDAALEEFRNRVETGDASVPDHFECDPPQGVADPLLAVEEASVEGEPAWFAAFGEVGEAHSIVAYRRSDCEVLRFDR